jgi:hypothetical protein
MMETPLFRREKKDINTGYYLQVDLEHVGLLYLREGYELVPRTGREHHEASQE